MFLSEHEPRKGTETRKKSNGLITKASIFQNMNPERGRKLCFIAQIETVYIGFRT